MTYPQNARSFGVEGRGRVLGSVSDSELVKVMHIAIVFVTLSVTANTRSLSEP
jgi:hypothetical protein